MVIFRLTLSLRKKLLLNLSGCYICMWLLLYEVLFFLLIYCIWVYRLLWSMCTTTSLRNALLLLYILHNIVWMNNRLLSCSSINYLIWFQRSTNSPLSLLLLFWCLFKRPSHNFHIILRFNHTKFFVFTDILMRHWLSHKLHLIYNLVIVIVLQIRLLKIFLNIYLLLSIHILLICKFCWV